MFAQDYDYVSLANILQRHIKIIPNDKLLKMINIFRKTLFSWKPKNFDMISFQRCCHILHSHFSMTEKFVRVMATLYERNQKRAQQRLYFWWIPICYDLKRESGQRMMERSWKRVESMYAEKG